MDPSYGRTVYPTAFRTDLTYSSARTSGLRHSYNMAPRHQAVYPTRMPTYIPQSNQGFEVSYRPLQQVMRTVMTPFWTSSRPTFSQVRTPTYPSVWQQGHYQMVPHTFRNMYQRHPPRNGEILNMARYQRPHILQTPMNVHRSPIVYVNPTLAMNPNIHRYQNAGANFYRYVNPFPAANPNVNLNLHSNGISRTFSNPMPRENPNIDSNPNTTPIAYTPNPGVNPNVRPNVQPGDEASYVFTNPTPGMSPNFYSYPLLRGFETPPPQECGNFDPNSRVFSNAIKAIAYRAMQDADFVHEFTQYWIEKTRTKQAPMVDEDPEPDPVPPPQATSSLRYQEYYENIPSQPQESMQFNKPSEQQANDVNQLLQPMSNLSTSNGNQQGYVKPSTIFNMVYYCFCGNVAFLPCACGLVLYCSEECRKRFCDQYGHSNCAPKAY